MMEQMFAVFNTAVSLFVSAISIPYTNIQYAVLCLQTFATDFNHSPASNCCKTYYKYYQESALMILQFLLLVSTGNPSLPHFIRQHGSAM